MGNYAKLFDAKTVYNEFLPMLFKFGADSVSRVGQDACPAMAEIIEKFDEMPEKQNGIVRVIKQRYFKSKTFKKRQLFILMMQGPMMMKKNIFEKYFKLDFLTLVNDKVPNVRILMAKALRFHFLKEISGTFVYDELFNEAVHVMKSDSCEEVRFLTSDIELYPADKTYEITMDEFMGKVMGLRGTDEDSDASEDESRIE